MAVQPPVGEPLGFPKCPKCAYLRTGPPLLCFRCANRTMEQIANRACDVCSQILDDDGTCPNWLCSDASRRISRVDAIAYSSGPLREKILAYKYDGKTGWALIFGRLLLAWLEQNRPNNPPDLIVANPTFVGSDGRTTPHTELVIAAAEREDTMGKWNFDVVPPRAIVKTQPTERSAKNSAMAKRAAAVAHVDALDIPDPVRIAGRHILIYDDVCTTGSQLDGVAGKLLDAGAEDVQAIVLARAPWRRRT
jgi:predicted amidophosphoribosyltransferase